MSSARMTEGSIYGDGVSALFEISDEKTLVVALAEPQCRYLACLGYLLEQLFVAVDPGFIFDVGHKNNIACHLITPNVGTLSIVCFHYILFKG